jgi:hypothetical protein
MSDEVELGIFQTDIALGDDYFKCDNLNHDWILLPILSELKEQSDGIIKEPGIYSFKLIVTKLK